MPRPKLTFRTLISNLSAIGSAIGLPRLKGDQGSSTVEYALTFILLMMMLFGVAGFGLGLYAYHFVANAAREATRWATVNGSACITDNSCKSPATVGDVRAYVGTIIPPGIDPTQVTVAATWPSTAGICAATSNAPGCTVKVQVTYKYNFIFPLIHTGPLTLSSSSDMTITH